MRKSNVLLNDSIHENIKLSLLVSYPLTTKIGAPENKLYLQFIYNKSNKTIEKLRKH